VNVPLERLALGDHAGAVESARELSSHLPDDSNVRMRHGLTLAAAGDPEWAEVLSVLANESEKLPAYVHGLCLLFQIDDTAILEDLR
jgi:hypothetical protein